VSGSKGESSSSQQSSYTPPPWAQAAGAQAMGTAQSLADTPFNIPTQPIASLQPQQTQAFEEVQSAQGMSQPYTNAATAQNEAGSAMEMAGGQPNSQLGQYFGQETAGVLPEMQNIFGQQDAQAEGSAVSQAGGLSADRIGVEQAELANQQGLSAGQTLSGIFGQSVSQSQAGQGLEQSAGSNLVNAGTAMSGLGTAAQTNALTGATAELQSGTLQQQQIQNEENAEYSNVLQQISWPFQTDQYLGSMAAGVTPSMGGSGITSGNTKSSSMGASGGGLKGGMSALGGASANGGSVPWLDDDNSWATDDGFKKGGRVKGDGQKIEIPPELVNAIIHHAKGGDEGGFLLEAKKIKDGMWTVGTPSNMGGAMQKGGQVQAPADSGFPIAIEPMISDAPTPQVVDYSNVPWSNTTQGLTPNTSLDQVPNFSNPFLPGANQGTIAPQQNTGTSTMGDAISAIQNDRASLVNQLGPEASTGAAVVPATGHYPNQGPNYVQSPLPMPLNQAQNLISSWGSGAGQAAGDAASNAYSTVAHAAPAAGGKATGGEVGNNGGTQVAGNSNVPSLLGGPITSLGSGSPIPVQPLQPGKPIWQQIVQQQMSQKPGGQKGGGGQQGGGGGGGKPSGGGGQGQNSDQADNAADAQYDNQGSGGSQPTPPLTTPFSGGSSAPAGSSSPAYPQAWAPGGGQSAGLPGDNTGLPGGGAPATAFGTGAGSPFGNITAPQSSAPGSAQGDFGGMGNSFSSAMPEGMANALGMASDAGGGADIAAAMDTGAGADDGGGGGGMGKGSAVGGRVGMADGGTSKKIPTPPPRPQDNYGSLYDSRIPDLPPAQSSPYQIHPMPNPSAPSPFQPIPPTATPNNTGGPMDIASGGRVHMDDGGDPDPSIGGDTSGATPPDPSQSMGFGVSNSALPAEKTADINNQLQYGIGSNLFNAASGETPQNPGSSGTPTPQGPATQQTPPQMPQQPTQGQTASQGTPQAKVPAPPLGPTPFSLTTNEPDDTAGYGGGSPQQQQKQQPTPPLSIPPTKWETLEQNAIDDIKRVGGFLGSTFDPGGALDPTKKDNPFAGPQQQKPAQPGAGATAAPPSGAKSVSGVQMPPELNQPTAPPMSPGRISPQAQAAPGKTTITPPAAPPPAMTVGEGLNHLKQWVPSPVMSFIQSRIDQKDMNKPIWQLAQDHPSEFQQLLGVVPQEHQQELIAAATKQPVQQSNLEPGHVDPSSQLPVTSSTPPENKHYANIAQLEQAVSQKYGIDPKIMAGIRHGEGGGNIYAHNPGVTINGKFYPEDSWGPWQLNRHGGEGTNFEKTHPGMTVRDPSTIEAQADYVAKTIREHMDADPNFNIQHIWHGYKGPMDVDPNDPYFGESGYGAPGGAQNTMQPQTQAAGYQPNAQHIQRNAGESNAQYERRVADANEPGKPGLGWALMTMGTGDPTAYYKFKQSQADWDQRRRVDYGAGSPASNGIDLANEAEAARGVVGGLATPVGGSTPGQSQQGQGQAAQQQPQPPMQGSPGAGPQGGSAQPAPTGGAAPPGPAAGGGINWQNILQQEAMRDQQIQSQAQRMMQISPSKYGAQAASMMQGIGQRQAGLLNSMAQNGKLNLDMMKESLQPAPPYGYWNLNPQTGERQFIPMADMLDKMSQGAFNWYQPSIGGGLGGGGPQQQQPAMQPSQQPPIIAAPGAVAPAGGGAHQQPIIPTGAEPHQQQSAQPMTQGAGPEAPAQYNIKSAAPAISNPHLTPPPPEAMVSDHEVRNMKNGYMDYFNPEGTKADNAKQLATQSPILQAAEQTEMRLQMMEEALKTGRNSEARESYNHFVKEWGGLADTFHLPFTLKELNTHDAVTTDKIDALSDQLALTMGGASGMGTRGIGRVMQYVKGSVPNGVTDNEASRYMINGIREEMHRAADNYSFLDHVNKQAMGYADLPKAQRLFDQKAPTEMYVARAAVNSWREPPNPRTGSPGGGPLLESTLAAAQRLPQYREALEKKISPEVLDYILGPSKGGKGAAPRSQPEQPQQQPQQQPQRSNQTVPAITMPRRQAPAGPQAPPAEQSGPFGNVPSSSRLIRDLGSNPFGP
jgi:hypothetical protein